MLRLDVSPGAVEFTARMAGLAVARLRARYQRIAAELGGDGGAFAGPSAREAAVPAAPEQAAPEYLRGLLCFREFRDHEQIAAVIGGAPLVEVPRGAVVVAADEIPAVLLVVVRGAVDVSVRRGGTAHRVRLAGPGRLVGHVGVLDNGPSPVVARTRERAVLIRIPAERAREMLREPSAAVRRFSAALAEDAARAAAGRATGGTDVLRREHTVSGWSTPGGITGLRRTQSWLHGRFCRMRNHDGPGLDAHGTGRSGPRAGAPTGPA